MSSSSPPALRDRLIALDTCSLSDALDALHLTGVVAGVHQLGPPRRIAGRVRTVELGSAEGPATSIRHLGTTAIEGADEGDIIAVAHRSRDDAAGWGGLLSEAARSAGVVGVVVDGLCRDIDDYFALDLPVYGRAATPVSARGRVVEVTSGEPIQLGGVAVSPADWLIADRSGVVVIAAADVLRVLETAEGLARRERQMSADIRGGMRVTEVLDRRYEAMLEHEDRAATNQPHNQEGTRDGTA